MIMDPGWVLSTQTDSGQKCFEVSSQALRHVSFLSINSEECWHFEVHIIHWRDLVSNLAGILECSLSLRLFVGGPWMSKPVFLALAARGQILETGCLASAEKDWKLERLRRSRGRLCPSV